MSSGFTRDYSRRQLLPNTAIAASRIAVYPCRHRASCRPFRPENDGGPVTDGASLAATGRNYEGSSTPLPSRLGRSHEKRMAASNAGLFLFATRRGSASVSPV